ncbi:MAG: protein tyrosine phosphatase family protein [Rhodospirillaceae bacterium]|nr:protein tyrosine phosphatase family protein [Rhodospirillaceae bacterium]
MSATLNGIKNFIEISDLIGTAGQPTADQFHAVRESGYGVVVNLLPQEQDNALKGEADLIANLGLAYHYIPVLWKAPKVEDFAAFCDVMQKLQGKKVFVHCAMNMRVTAFYSSYAMKHLGWTHTQADDLVARIWARGDYKMDDTWRAFIERIRQ